MLGLALSVLRSTCRAALRCAALRCAGRAGCGGGAQGPGQAGVDRGREAQRAGRDKGMRSVQGAHSARGLLGRSGAEMRPEQPAHTVAAGPDLLTSGLTHPQSLRHASNVLRGGRCPAPARRCRTWRALRWWRRRWRACSRRSSSARRRERLLVVICGHSGRSSSSSRPGVRGGGGGEQGRSKGGEVGLCLRLPGELGVPDWHWGCACGCRGAIVICCCCCWGAGRGRRGEREVHLSRSLGWGGGSGLGRKHASASLQGRPAS